MQLTSVFAVVSLRWSRELCFYLNEVLSIWQVNNYTAFQMQPNTVLFSDQIFTSER